MDKQLDRIESGKSLAEYQFKNTLDSDTVIARLWIQLGLNYVKQKCYLKAVLCFETALTVDSLSMNAEHILIRGLILAGKLQEAYKFVSNVCNPCIWNVKEPWAFA